ncbi:hypothetical protein, partial [Haloferax profundi]|uniref:hypothetical protein n=1 Tax=Haloferax profundi TaxID=1544718 RepID=UPI0009EC72E2
TSSGKRAESSPQSTATETSTGTPSPFIQQGLEFKSYLAEQEITVEELKAFPSKRAIQLIYISNEENYQAVGGEVGSIAGGFFRHLADGWSAERLNATVLDSPDSPFGSWYAKAEWFQQYQSGELSADELSLKVLNTLEPAEDT